MLAAKLLSWYRVKSAISLGRSTVALMTVSLCGARVFSSVDFDMLGCLGRADGVVSIRACFSSSTRCGRTEPAVVDTIGPALCASTPAVCTVVRLARGGCGALDTGDDSAGSRGEGVQAGHKDGRLGAVIEELVGEGEMDGRTGWTGTDVKGGLDDIAAEAI